MHWTPNTAELELIVSHAAARVPAAVTAKALGVEVEDLRELAQRLAQGRGFSVSKPERAEAAETTPQSMRNPHRVFR